MVDGSYPHTVSTSIDFREFIESYPLYKKSRGQTPYYFAKAVPSIVELLCPVCKSSRPHVSHHEYGRGDPGDARFGPGLFFFSYVCTYCDTSVVNFWVETNEAEGWIQKIGQRPPWLPSIPKDIEADLGDDAELYKKALRNMNESYGLGAVAYLRRLFENQINPLLKVLYEIKETTGASPEELATIQAAIEERNFTKKTAFASEIAPADLMIDGFNPFKIIHDRLSDALHNLDEETCMTYATEISEALVYIIRELKRHHQQKKDYAARMKAIRTLSEKTI
jgi:hypothetical protein